MISVIICTYNRAGSLVSTLDSLARTVISPGFKWEIIVVDNNSTDNTRDTVEMFSSRIGVPVTYVMEPRQGLSFARNTGIERSRGEILAFTDDDITVHPDWLNQIADAFHELQCAGIGGRVVPQWETEPPYWFEERGPFATPKAIVDFDLGDAVCPAGSAPFGANMAFNREAFLKHGLFRTDLGRGKNDLMGGEDKEWFKRLSNAGETVLYLPDAIVFHPVAPERMTRAYFERWCYDAARSQIRADGVPAHTTYWFGVPRYMLRSVVTNCFRWIVTFASKRRFYYKLQTLISAGTIVETRMLNK